MRRRIHLKKKNKIINTSKKNKIIILTVLSIIISVIISLNMISKKITPIILETAELEINKYSTIVVNKAISQVLEDKINTDNIFSTIKSESGEIETIDFNPIVVNQVLNVATSVVQENLRLLEEGNFENLGIEKYREIKKTKLKKGIITEIPMGIVFKNTVLSNIGPKIPIRMHYLGDVNSNITTKITPYGINNALVEVGVHLEMTAQIILPLITKKTVLDCNIPIAIKLIQGNIPSYYGSNLVKDSSLYSIPFQDS